MKRVYLIFSFVMLILLASNTSLFAMSSSPIEEGWKWKSSTPEEQGMDSNELIRALDYIEGANIDLDSLLIIRNGHIVTELYYPPYGMEDTKNIYSSTKSVLSALIGIALEEGYLESLEQPVSEFFPQYYREDMDLRKKEMTIEDLLTMSSGYDSLSYIIDSEINLAKNTINTPLIDEPGEKFRYGDINSDHLAIILKESTGMPLVDFANKYLFGPMGIDDFKWANSSEKLKADKNYYTGGSGLYLKPRDMAKFGYLFLNNGYWEGKKVVPEDWVQKSTKRQIFAGGRQSGILPEDYYGYHWWITERGYLASGIGGQLIEVIPELDMVIVVTAQDNRHYPVDLLYRITSTVKGNLPLEEVDIGSRELEKRIKRIENPRAKEVIHLPEKASQISGKVYNLEDNPLKIEGLRLEFIDDKTANLILKSPLIIDKIFEVDLEGIEIEVGLDGIYRKSNVEYRSDLHNIIEGDLIARGEWRSENSFNIELRDKANFKLDFNLRFMDDQLTGFLEVVPSFYPLHIFLMGETGD